MSRAAGTAGTRHAHHKGGQILLAAGGRGWYQTRANPPGNSAPEAGWTSPPEVQHWHEAAADSWVSHLAVAIPPEGGSNQWLEPVSGEEYGKL